MKKIAFFDLDGTLKLKGQGVSNVLLNYLMSLWSSEISTTLITGKSYLGLVNCLKDDLKSIIHPGLCIGVENGSKAVTIDGNLIYSKVFSVSDLLLLSKFLESNLENIAFLAFSRGDKIAKGSIWVFDNEYLEFVNNKYREYFDIVSVKVSDFMQKFQGLNTGMFSVKAKSLIDTSSLLDDFEVSTNEGYININPKTVNKAFFVTELANMHKLKLKDLIVVGNDSNDFPMFKLDVGRKIFVLTEHEKASLEFGDLVFCESPEGLIEVGVG